jgi:predicted RNA binding protein YcfA (HicA-like mRNA interferase family)
MALERAGFVFRRQTGSHMVLRRAQPYGRVVVPDHKQIRLGTLRRIVADADLLWTNSCDSSGDDGDWDHGLPSWR